MRIMLVGDSTAVISGFGSALRNLATYLHKRGHTITHLGWQTMGQERIASFGKDVLGYTVLPNIGGQQFGEMAFKYWLPKWKPDLVITLADFWMISYMFKMETNVPVLMWYPIDGFPMTDQITDMLKQIDYTVCMSEYGTKMVTEKGLNTKHIPHGVKSKVFTPKPEDVRAAMRREIGIPEGKVIVGRVDRNQTRKKIPRTIKAFVKLHKQFPDTVLYLHMDKRDREGWDLPYIVKRFGLKEGKDVFFPTQNMLANFMYGIEENRLAIIMSMIDIHLWLTGGEGFGLCVGSDTLLSTIDGVTEIGNDVIGDSVLSKNGTFKEILAKKSREVDDYYKIKTQKNDTIKVSSEHPFYGTKASRHMLNKHPNDEWLNWMPTETLEVGDFLATPIPKLDKELPKTIDMSIFDELIEHDNEHVWYKMGFSSKISPSFSSIVKDTNTSKKVVENTVNHIRNNEEMKSNGQISVHKHLTDINYTLPTPKTYNRYIKLDNDLLWLFGWYLAEGSGNAGSIELSLGKNDEQYIDRIMNIFEEKFGDTMTRLDVDKKIRLIASGQIYEKMFKSLFGCSALDKHIPLDLMLGGNKLLSLVEGLILGDGHVRDKSACLVSISRNLVYQARTILLSNRILTSVSKNDNSRGFKSTNDLYELKITGKAFYKLNALCGFNNFVPKRTGSSEIYLENYVLTPIRKIEHIFEKETLQDIQVKDEKSFVGNGYLLHNTGLETMSSGAVNIASNYTTPPEIFQFNKPNACGLPVNIETFETGAAGVDRALADTDHAYEQMKWLLENRDEMAQMSKNGVERAKSHYDWTLVTENFDNIIRDLNISSVKYSKVNSI